MKVLENEARATGVTEIGLSISLPSKRFYESLGYKVVEERSRDVGEGQRLDFWKAAKQLSKRGLLDEQLFQHLVLLGVNPISMGGST